MEAFLSLLEKAGNLLSENLVVASSVLAVVLNVLFRLWPRVQPLFVYIGMLFEFVGKIFLKLDELFGKAGVPNRRPPPQA